MIPAVNLQMDVEEELRHSEWERWRSRFTGSRACRPFVKWAGGKSSLLPELVARVPERYNTYFEPFVGGGALFFHLLPPRACLSDVSPELINAYRVVKSRVGELIKDLETHVYEREYYYKIREVDRLPEYEQWSSVRRAGRMIYLNKTCFNGLYRVNSRGFFNTPFGRYSNPTIVDAVNLRNCSRALRAVHVMLASFDWIEEEARRGDFVYLDPPYAPLSGTSNFTTYTTGGFGADQQRALRDTCRVLDQKGAKFLLSNSTAPLILKLFDEFHIERVRAGRAINSKAAGRGKIEEVLIRNYC